MLTVYVVIAKQAVNGTIAVSAILIPKPSIALRVPKIKVKIMVFWLTIVSTYYPPV